MCLQVDFQSVKTLFLFVKQTSYRVGRQRKTTLYKRMTFLFKKKYPFRRNSLFLSKIYFVRMNLLNMQPYGLVRRRRMILTKTMTF